MINGMQEIGVDKPEFRDSDLAFIQAINEGRLSIDMKKPNWAGHYMYMGHWNGTAKFKNIATRKYDV